MSQTRQIPPGLWTRRLEARLKQKKQRAEEWRLWFERLRASPFFRLLVATGLWRRRLNEALELSKSGAIEWHHFPPPQTTARLELSSSFRPPAEGTVAIDLSSLLAGAENGGAKTVALALVEELARAHPETQFLVLIGDDCADELVGLERDNLKPLEMPVKLDDTFERRVDEGDIRVLLCPMTVSRWIDPRVPTVCVIHDLQHRALPWFFEGPERDRRERDLERVAWAADEVICVSDSTRRHLLAGELPSRAAGSLPAESDLARPVPASERVTVVHNRIASRLPDLDEGEVRRELDRLRLASDDFVLYPANFWPHKNHQTLLHGFSLFCHQHPKSQLSLVFTGAQRPDPAPVLEAIRRLGLEQRVRYLGFVDERQLAALYRGGRALIFPSLFEGFGMPILEAMTHGLPVFASNLEVHREVAGDAAEFFDPRTPEAIRAAFEILETEPERLNRLRDLGESQAARLGDVRTMGQEYWQVLERATSRPHGSIEISGRFHDGWTAERFLITHTSPCELVLELCNPLSRAATVEFRGAQGSGEVEVPAGKSVRVQGRLASKGGWIEGWVSPAFRPAEETAGGDVRSLGVMMRRCYQCLEDGSVLDLLAEA